MKKLLVLLVFIASALTASEIDKKKLAAVKRSTSIEIPKKNIKNEPSTNHSPNLDSPCGSGSRGNSVTSEPGSQQNSYQGSQIPYYNDCP